MASSQRSIAETLPLPTSPAAISIPQLGLGTYLSPPDQTFASCLHALRAGYRHIDTGQYYANEHEVGRAIEASGVPRDQVFVSTKILETGDSVDEDYAKALESVGKLGGYVDLFLIHSPNCGAVKMAELWLALERLYKEGKARAIGVSNFGVGEIEQLKSVGEVWPPHANQIELHPWCQQKEAVEFCEKNSIVLQAYCPIVRNQKADFPPLGKIATKHDVSPNQVLIRWCLQRGWVCLPKSDDPERICTNASVYHFELDNEDMAVLNGLDEGQKGAIVMAVSSTR
ncbi:unnamed protein product [Discula destructiva]